MDIKIIYEHFVFLVSPRVLSFIRISTRLQRRHYFNVSRKKKQSNKILSTDDTGKIDRNNEKKNKKMPFFFSSRIRQIIYSPRAVHVKIPVSFSHYTPVKCTRADFFLLEFFFNKYANSSAIQYTSNGVHERNIFVEDRPGLLFPCFERIFILEYFSFRQLYRYTVNNAYKRDFM